MDYVLSGRYWIYLFTIALLVSGYIAFAPDSNQTLRRSLPAHTTPQSDIPQNAMLLFSDTAANMLNQRLRLDHQSGDTRMEKAFARSDGILRLSIELKSPAHISLNSQSGATLHIREARINAAFKASLGDSFQTILTTRMSFQHALQTPAAYPSSVTQDNATPNLLKSKDLSAYRHDGLLNTGISNALILSLAESTITERLSGQILRMEGLSLADASTPPGGGNYPSHTHSGNDEMPCPEPSDCRSRLTAGR